MKNFLVILALTLFSVTINAQKQWSAEFGFGNHTIADESSDLENNVYHIDGVVRYSFNERFGVGVYGGFDDLSLEHHIGGQLSKTEYWRVNLEGIADILEITNLSNNYFTILAHGGPGVSIFNADNDYSEVTPNISGGFTGILKITEQAALKIDWTTTAHFNQSRTFDGRGDVTNVGIQSFINNASIGIAFYFGKSKSHSDEHYDWYVEPKKDLLAPVRPIIREYHNT